MAWFSADATAAFFGKERWLGGVLQPLPGGDLAERVERAFPLLTSFPALPGNLLRMRCEDEEGESLVRKREFGPKLWRRDLGELKAS